MWEQLLHGQTPRLLEGWAPNLQTARLCSRASMWCFLELVDCFLTERSPWQAILWVITHGWRVGSTLLQVHPKNNVFTSTVYNAVTCICTHTDTHTHTQTHIYISHNKYRNFLHGISAQIRPKQIPGLQSVNFTVQCEHQMFNKTGVQNDINDDCSISLLHCSIHVKAVTIICLHIKILPCRLCSC